MLANIKRTTIGCGRSLSRMFNTEAYLVAGLGRCGTTLMCSSIKYKNALVSNRTRFLPGLEGKKFSRGVVYKTHNFPPPYLPRNLKVIFMFGNPCNAALSAYYNLSCTDHHKHVNVERSKDAEEIFSRDIYNMETCFDAWYQPQGFEFLSLRYESIYKPSVQKMLYEFLGFQPTLPNKKQRRTDYRKHSRRLELEATYGSLCQKVDEAVDARIWQGRSVQCT